MQLDELGKELAAAEEQRDELERRLEEGGRALSSKAAEEHAQKGQHDAAAAALAALQKKVGGYDAALAEIGAEREGEPAAARTARLSGAVVDGSRVRAACGQASRSGATTRASS